MKPRFLAEHIHNFMMNQEPEFIELYITKWEYKEMAEILLSFSIDLIQKVQSNMQQYTSSSDYLLVELVRKTFSQKDIGKWALLPYSKEYKYKLNVGIALTLLQVMQQMGCNTHGQSLLNKIDKELVDYGFYTQNLLAQ